MKTLRKREEPWGVLDMKEYKWLLVLGFLDQEKYENAASRSETFIKDSVWGGNGREEKTCGCVFLWGKNL